jgi:hypothetical protein
MLRRLSFSARLLTRTFTCHGRAVAALKYSLTSQKAASDGSEPLCETAAWKKRRNELMKANRN